MKKILTAIFIPFLLASCVLQDDGTTLECSPKIKGGECGISCWVGESDVNYSLDGNADLIIRKVNENSTIFIMSDAGAMVLPSSARCRYNNF